MTRLDAALIATCPHCGGIKAIECEAQDDNKLVQTWIDRGDIVGADLASVVSGELWRCGCERGERKS